MDERHTIIPSKTVPPASPLSCERWTLVPRDSARRPQCLPCGRSRSPCKHPPTHGRKKQTEPSSSRVRHWGCSECNTRSPLHASRWLWNTVLVKHRACGTPCVWNTVFVKQLPCGTWRANEPVSQCFQGDTEGRCSLLSM